MKASKRPQLCGLFACIPATQRKFIPNALRVGEREVGQMLEENACVKKLRGLEETCWYNPKRKPTAEALA